MEDSLIQTIAILGACLVYISKEAIGAVKSRNGKNSNGNKIGHSTIEMQISDLHKWHKPQMDQQSGQPKFHWYVSELRKEICGLRNSIDDLTKIIKNKI